MNATNTSPRKYSHYFRPCPYAQIDVYRVLKLFQVTDPALAHAVKKLLVAGGRGAKDQAKDVAEAADALARWQEMRAEESGADDPVAAPKLLPWELARESVLELHPKAICIQWDSSTWIISINAEKNWDRRLGDGLSGWDAWLDAALRIQKSKAA